MEALTSEKFEIFDSYRRAPGHLTARIERVREAREFFGSRYETDKIVLTFRYSAMDHDYVRLSFPPNAEGYSAALALVDHMSQCEPVRLTDKIAIGGGLEVC